MEWIDSCIKELRKENLFQSREHEELFRDTVNCYEKKPFFTAGLCKCIYSASWDMEHFTVFLDPINTMVLRGDKNLDYMKELGRVLAEEGEEQSLREMYMYLLAESFLENETFILPEEVEQSGADWLEIYHCVVKAAEIIEMYYKK